MIKIKELLFYEIPFVINKKNHVLNIQFKSIFRVETWKQRLRANLNNFFHINISVI